MKKFRFTWILVLILTVLVTSCQSPEQFFEFIGDVAEVGMKSADSITKAIEDFTPENEYYIGRSVAATLLNHYTLADTPEMNRYLTTMANSMAALDVSHAVPLKGYFVAVLDTDEINAFATAGGHIFITRGFIVSMENEDQLAAVIAHEISHVQLKHGLNAIKTNRRFSAGMDVLANSIEVFSKGNSTKEDFDELVSTFEDMTGVGVDTLVNSGYGQSAEYAADQNAIELLTLSGYNPAAMFEMLSVINTPSANYGSGFGKTHPKPKDRINQLHKKYSTVAIQPTDPVRISRFQKQLKRL